MRFFTVLTGVLAAAFMAASAPAGPPPRSLDPDARLDAAIQAAQQRGQAQQAPLLDNFKLVGHSDLGGDIDFGDVWAHGDYAYVGSRWFGDARRMDFVRQRRVHARGGCRRAPHVDAVVHR